MTEQHTSPQTSEVREQLAERFGLTTTDVDALVDAMDEARGTLGPEEMSQGLAMVVKSYVDALASAAERFSDPDERQVADRMVNLTVELLTSQLASANQVRS